MYKNEETPIILNYTGYILEVQKFPLRTRHEDAPVYHRIVLPVFGTPKLKIEENFCENDEFGTVNVDITGIPPARMGSRVVLTPELAPFVYGARKDIMIPAKYHFESTKNILKPDEMKIVCENLSDIIVII